MARRAYAKGTAVPVTRTKAELEQLLRDHGADAVLAGENFAAAQAFVAFQLKGRNVRLDVPLPRRDDRAFTHKRVNASTTKHKRSELEARRAWEQGCAERWRSVWLLVRAKLEAIELGHTTIDREFLHDMLVGDPRDGRTLGDALARGELDGVLTAPGVPLLPPAGGC